MTLILICILIAIVAVLVSRRNMSAHVEERPKHQLSVCKWRKTGRVYGDLIEYKCDTCSKVAVSSERSGPVYCRKDTSGGAL